MRLVYLSELNTMMLASWFAYGNIFVENTNKINEIQLKKKFKMLNVIYLIKLSGYIYRGHVAILKFIYYIWYKIKQNRKPGFEFYVYTPSMQLLHVAIGRRICYQFQVCKSLQNGDLSLTNFAFLIRNGARNLHKTQMDFQSC